MIGVLGGYGAVGAHVVRLLREWDAGPLRVGSRRTEAALRVDVTDSASLAAFVHGCEVVVNCAGPSFRWSELVARAALDAGAGYVDAGGPAEPPELPDLPGTAVFHAGAWPGLSGLLPRWLAAEHRTRPGRLTSYIGALDRFTETGAEDYLHGVLDTGASVAGRRLRLPFFPAELTAHSYVDGETRAVTAALGRPESEWWSVVEGPALAATLERARSLPRPEAVAALCRASALDAAGRTPYCVFLVELDGRTAYARGAGIAELTGAMTAVASLAVRCGDVEGAGLAATALDPLTTVERLRAAGVLTELTVYDRSIADLAVVEEGVL